MQLREPDGLEDFARVGLVQEVTQRDGIAVDGERLEPDGLHDRVVHDQEVGVKLMPSSAAIFGRPGAGAREGEPTAGQRMEIHAGPISPVHDQGAVRRRPPREGLRVGRTHPSRPGNQVIAPSPTTG